MKKLIQVALMLSLVISSPNALAQEDDMAATLERDAKVTRKKAADIALAQVQGTIVSTDIEKEDGSLYWCVDVQVAGSLNKEVRIDAMSGDVTRILDYKDCNWSVTVKKLSSRKVG